MQQLRNMLQERTEDINMVKDYEDFKKFVLGLTGIDLNAYKEKQMKRRIDTLIARNKHTGYDSYCNAIKNDAQMLDEFVNYLTINVSEFYRNPALWKKLDEIILPDLIKKFGPRLKIWSAACSTGDEPYSLAMVLAKKIITKLTDILECDGYNVLQNNGPAAGQTVFHFHMHLIPRYKGDKNDDILKYTPLELSDDEMKEILDMIKVK